VYKTISEHDGFGNLKTVDITTGNIGNQHSFSESYSYDVLHRLATNAVNGITTINYSYDAVGNLLSKSDYATSYDYSNGTTGGPNAVKRVYRSGSWRTFSYDARGNMTKGDGLTSATYNAMDKPTQIQKDGKTLNFTYGPQHMRFKQVNGSVTTFYSDKLYEEEINGSKTTWRAYIDDIAVISQTTNEGATIRYTHRDRLGSARVFTDHNGQVEAERNFDPFGKPRLATGGLKPVGNAKLGDKTTAKTNRGFTDHEHLDNVELIHMNGRVYDYNLGRFMSVDPVIQSPTNSQSINPYSYIMNNPLSGTDPTGYSSCTPEDCQNEPQPLEIVITSGKNKGESSSSPNVAGGDIGRKGSSDNPSASINNTPSNGTSNKQRAARSTGQKVPDINSPSETNSNLSNYTSGSITPINGSPAFGYLKSVAKAASFDILYGDISRFASLNADPIDKADMWAYDEQAGAEKYAMMLLPGNMTKTATQGVRSGFSSFTSLKRQLGPAGKGYAWHHIVEQTSTNIKKFGVELIHNTGNIVILPHGKNEIHQKISGFYSSKQPFTGGQTVRQWVSQKSYQEQYDFGVKVMNRFKEK